MRKAAMAEWILSMFIDPPRASAVVGDLEERSALSWISVGRITASSVAADLRDRPGALAFLAVQALILQLALPFLRTRIFPAQSWVDFPAGSLPILWLVQRAQGEEVAAFLALMFWDILFSVLIALKVEVQFHPATSALYVTAMFTVVGVERLRRLRHAQS